MLVLPLNCVYLPYLFLIVLDKFECCENIGSIGGDGHRVLEVGCGLAIAGAACPSVFLGELDVLGAHAHHGFDSDDHTFLEERTGTGDAVVGHIGRFVHLESHTVATEFTDDGITVFLTMHLDSMADVPHPIASLALVKADEEGFAGNLEEALHLGSGLASGESVGRVGHITVELDDTVERDIVAFLDKEVTGDAMDNDIVDRNAEGRGETLETFAEGLAPLSRIICSPI